MGACSPRKILEFKTSKIASAGFSGQVSLAKIIHIPGRKKNYDKRMLGNKQKLLGYMCPGVPGLGYATDATKLFLHY